MWEACMTLNDNWGYHAGDTNWKRPLQIIQMLTETASKSGNLLLNVGPKADGSLPLETVAILEKSGAWLRRNGAAIYGSSRAPFTWSNWGRVTTRGHCVYLHIWNNAGAQLCFAEMKNQVRSARFLDGGGDIDFTQSGTQVTLKGLPVPLSDFAVVIELEVEDEPEAVSPQTTFWIPE